ncbi:MAG: type II toxin-antitoxin system YafQ family toxin [Spirochaetaceae bacterium]|jgi:mRNA interferase YafQ|nr:type II toxin-antitoxin system YafQ family toxin [Spirochaetaceae bacterium]
MLSLVYTTKFRRDLKLQEKRGKDRSKIDAILKKLQQEEPLDPKYRDHALSGNWLDYRECHIENDWLLIYRIIRNELVLIASRTGTHSDLGW